MDHQLLMVVDTHFARTETTTALYFSIIGFSIVFAELLQDSFMYCELVVFKTSSL